MAAGRPSAEVAGDLALPDHHNYVNISLLANYLVTVDLDIVEHGWIRVHSPDGLGRERALRAGQRDGRVHLRH